MINGLMERDLTYTLRIRLRERLATRFRNQVAFDLAWDITLALYEKLNAESNQLVMYINQQLTNELMVPNARV